MKPMHELYRDIPTLATERLVLRKMTEGDVEDIFRYASDPEVPTYLRWDPHPERDATAAYVSQVLSDYASGRDGPWAIVLKETGRVIGAIHIYKADEIHQWVEIGYVLARDQWNHGYMTEALARVVSFCFHELGVNRIQALCKLPNVASTRVLEKAGFLHEGTLGEYLHEKGRFWDVHIYAVLKRNARELKQNG
jgi:ribosomal-protein-alanine N-acetyltransferase